MEVFIKVIFQNIEHFCFQMFVFFFVFVNLDVWFSDKIGEKWVPDLLVLVIFHFIIWRHCYLVATIMS